MCVSSIEMLYISSFLASLCKLNMSHWTRNKVMIIVGWINIECVDFANDIFLLTCKYKLRLKKVQVETMIESNAT